MPSGPGFWLDPRTSQLHRVTTHNDWLLVPENQNKVGLSSHQRQVLASFDPIREIDEIRMVGVMHGLVRIRDYFSRLSVQFYSLKPKELEILHSVLQVIPKVTRDTNPYLTVQNLYGDSVAQLRCLELKTKLSVFVDALQPQSFIDYNEQLRQKMTRLFRTETQ